MKINEILTENKSSLFSDLKVMKPKFAQIAQSIYNRWSGKNYGSGICDEIAWRNAEYVNKKKFEIGAIALPHGRNKAGNHAYAVVFNKKEAFLIDIPYWKYETSKILKVKDHPGVKDLFWRKIPDVTFTYNDVRIIAIPRQKFMRWRDVVKTLCIVQKTHDSFKMIGESTISERIAPHADKEGYRIPRAHREEVGCSECGRMEGLEQCGTYASVADPICPTCRKRWDYRPCERCGINHIKGVCPQVGAMAGKASGK